MLSGFKKYWFSVYKYNNSDKLFNDKKVIVFDTETTGLDCYRDEILQLSVINGTGKVLFNEYIKPLYKCFWKKAEAIHGISPRTVENCKHFKFHKRKIQRVFNKAKVLIAYNADFDLGFLRRAGIKINTDKKIIIDPMNDYSDYNHCKWQKLLVVARRYGYVFAAHDSLEDVKATLFVAERFYNEVLPSVCSKEKCNGDIRKV